MKKFLSVLIILFSVLQMNVVLAEIFDEVSESIKSGDVKSLSRSFNNSIDLTVGSQENTYSKAQAEQVLRDFFNENKPFSFSFIHQGLSKEGAKYAIGRLTTYTGKTFRVYLYIKQESGAFLINELRFMPE